MPRHRHSPCITRSAIGVEGLLQQSVSPPSCCSHAGPQHFAGEETIKVWDIAQAKVCTGIRGRISYNIIFMNFIDWGFFFLTCCKVVLLQLPRLPGCIQFEACAVGKQISRVFEVYRKKCYCVRYLYLDNVEENICYVLNSLLNVKLYCK